jgi:hypothetical protein
MAGALEIMHARARAAKNAGGAPSNKATKPTAQPQRLPGLPLASSRFSSKGARALAIEAKLVEADFAGRTPSGQQDRFTIEDVQTIADAKAKGAK